MNTEEKLNILGAKLDEAYETIRDMDITDERFHGVFHLAGEIEWKMDSIRHPEPDDFVTPKQDLDPAPVEQSDSPAPAKEDKPEQPTLTKADMIVKLTPHQNNGVDIGAVMKDMGYAKLSDVPAARYWELLENVQKAADGEG